MLKAVTYNFSPHTQILLYTKLKQNIIHILESGYHMWYITYMACSSNRLLFETFSLYLQHMNINSNHGCKITKEYLHICKIYIHSKAITITFFFNHISQLHLKSYNYSILIYLRPESDPFNYTVHICTYTKELSQQQYLQLDRIFSKIQSCFQLSF
jgi:hypothetical protein